MTPSFCQSPEVTFLKTLSMRAIYGQPCFTALSTGMLTNLVHMKVVTETGHTRTCVENEVDGRRLYLFLISKDAELLKMVWTLECRFKSSVSLSSIIVVSPWLFDEWLP